MRELILFKEALHPRNQGATEIPALLDHRPIERRTPASSPNQALGAILVLDKRVLALVLPLCEGLGGARRPAHVPAVLGRWDPVVDLDRVAPRLRLLGERLSGEGLRLAERLRRRSKVLGLDAPIDAVRARHQAELATGRGEIDRPHGLRTTMSGAVNSLRGQHLSPGSRPGTDPAMGRLVLDHLRESAVQQGGRARRDTPHFLRHRLATHRREGGTKLHALRTLLGHEGIRSAGIDTAFIDRGRLGGVRPEGR